jgi:hypothetical protein
VKKFEDKDAIFRARRRRRETEDETTRERAIRRGMRVE